mmetsp:Transcript_33297/g.79852  ORF Transcript_33297/g.79852 Transcript_33297/m.79852 type:complete len:412 (+) Transcript_33297:969-2204(+)
MTSAGVAFKAKCAADQMASMAFCGAISDRCISAVTSCLIREVRASFRCVSLSVTMSSSTEKSSGWAATASRSCSMSHGRSPTRKCLKLAESFSKLLMKSAISCAERSTGRDSCRLRTGWLETCGTGGSSSCSLLLLGAWIAGLALGSEGTESVGGGTEIVEAVAVPCVMDRSELVGTGRESVGTTVGVCAPVSAGVRPPGSGDSPSVSGSALSPAPDTGAASSCVGLAVGGALGKLALTGALAPSGGIDWPGCAKSCMFACTWFVQAWAPMNCASCICDDAATDSCREAIHCFTVARKASGIWTFSFTALLRLLATMLMSLDFMPSTICDMYLRWLSVMAGAMKPAPPMPWEGMHPHPVGVGSGKPMPGSMDACDIGICGICGICGTCGTMLGYCHMPIMMGLQRVRRLAN